MIVAAQDQLPLFGACQRWRGRRATYRPAGESFTPSRYAVEPIPAVDDRLAAATMVFRNAT